MFTSCVLLSYRVVAEEMQGLCHVETGQRKGNMRVDKCLPLLKISFIEGTSGDETNGICHRVFVINVVRGLCHAATN